MVFPSEFELDSFQDWEFEHFFVQPKDEKGYDHTQETLQMATQLGWRASIQIHKHLGIE